MGNIRFELLLSRSKNNSMIYISSLNGYRSLLFALIHICIIVDFTVTQYLMAMDHQLKPQNSIRTVEEFR